jgi:tetratricopeptide (TPR) repeat protein
MKPYLISLVIIFFMSSLLAQAQTNVQVSKKDFKQGKQGFDEAWNHIQEGDKYFSEGGKYYNAAFDEYLKAIVYNSSNPELNYKTGISALFSDKKEEAAPFLIKAMEAKKVVAEDILVVTGRALQYQERFTEAITIFDEFLNFPGKKSEELVSLAQKFQAECNSGLIITKDTLRIDIANLGENINSAFDDFSEILTEDGRELYFASGRDEKTAAGSDQNIFYSSLSDSSWIPAVLAGENITTKFSETPVYIDSTGNILYIYAGYENNGDIKMSARRKEKWDYPQDISYPVNTDGSETSFFIGSSGTEIYFISDGVKDNLGGKDIYYVSKLTEKRWSKPVNAGSIINTSSDEESVVLSKTGDTIWFSSKGHNSIGGYDVFYSVRNQAGVWDTVKNIGYPVNSPWDEVFYKPSPVDDSLFYFVSNRKGGLGGLDIYSGKISPQIPDPVSLPEAEQPIVPDKEGAAAAVDPAGLKKEEKLFFQ